MAYRPIILKQFYYLDHFFEMVDFLETRCHGVLSEEERTFLKRFKASPKKIQGLVVRLANRKGRVFDASRLRYAELGDCLSLAEELREAHFLRSPLPAEIPLVVASQSKQSLLDLLDRRGQTTTRFGRAPQSEGRRGGVGQLE